MRRHSALIVLMTTFSFVLLGATQRASAQDCSWVQKFPEHSPSPRYEHAMAYDSARGVTVLFGGGYDPARYNDTREWNGSAWTLQATTGPSPRRGHAMAYDSARGVTVLFGGIDSGDEYNRETWEWNGAAWTLRATAGPSARSSHALAYDSARAVTVLFGGIDNGGYDGTTWEWNGSAWTRRATTGPSPRLGHDLGYDSARGVTVLFGGDHNGPLGDTWEWDGATWILRATTGPSARSHHAMAYDSARGVTVLFGASSGEGSWTWEWDGSAWALRATSGPSRRTSHAMAYDSARGVTVLFGGNDGSFDGETWEYGVWCSGLERIKKASCKDRNGTNQLKVILADGLEGDTFIVTLTDSSTESGAVNARGKGKAKFNNRPPGDAGIATAEWACGATNEKDYTCP